jgi:hypothetical protein
MCNRLRVVSSRQSVPERHWHMRKSRRVACGFRSTTRLHMASRKGTGPLKERRKRIRPGISLSRAVSRSRARSKLSNTLPASPYVHRAPSVRRTVARPACPAICFQEGAKVPRQYPDKNLPRYSFSSHFQEQKKMPLSAKLSGTIESD